MTFRRIFANTIPPPDWSSARARTLALYREWLREVPRAITKYPLEVNVATARARIRYEFDRNRRTNDLSVTHVLILKGTQELIELHNKWKQKVHVMRYFEGQWERRMNAHNPLNQSPKPATIPSSSFLSNFLSRNA